MNITVCNNSEINKVYNTKFILHKIVIRQTIIHRLRKIINSYFYVMKIICVQVQCSR